MNGPLPERQDRAASADPLGPAVARHLGAIPVPGAPAPPPPFHRGALHSAADQVGPAPAPAADAPVPAAPQADGLPGLAPQVAPEPEPAAAAADLGADADLAAVAPLATGALEPWAEDTQPQPTAGREPVPAPAEAADLAAFAWAEEAALTLRSVQPGGEAGPAPAGTEAGSPPILLDEVAARLEQIARTLRERRPAEIFAGGAADPLEILITGYALGYTEAARHARQGQNQDPGVG